MKENRSLKRILIVLAAVTVLLASVSLAEDLSSMTDEELLQLYSEVTAELETRGITITGDDSPEARSEAIERLVTFFSYWAQERLDDMLTMCAPDWTGKAEDARIALFRILANRVPRNLIVESETEDPECRTIQVTSILDRQNGMAPENYRLWIVMKRAEDGLWYVDPDSLLTFEKAEDELQEEPTPQLQEEINETPDNMVLYYNPTSGQYYHADQNCRCVNPKYLPLDGMFTYAELEDEKYRDLQPCNVCGAPLRKEQPQFASFSEAVEAAGESAAVGGGPNSLAVMMEKDGKYLRAVTELDDHAKELYRTALEAEDTVSAFEAFDAYAWSLPVSYTEVFPETPKKQAELDALAGKTILQLLFEEDFMSVTYPDGSGQDPAVFILASGIFEYAFEADATYEEYLEAEAEGRAMDLKVKSGSLLGFSTFAINPDYHPDGTYEETDNWNE